MDDLTRDATDGLLLAMLPPLPQSRTIRSTALRLWRDPRVVAIWLGGSLASGAGDPYSDIDLRIAVAPTDLAAWQSPDFTTILESSVLGAHFLRFGETTYLHHLVLGNGDILDFMVQSVEATPSSEPLLVLACRETAYAERLQAANHLSVPEETPATGASIRELLVAFWINSHKHRKVLYRDLDLMFSAGAYTNWTMLMRLWYIAATGHDTNPRHFSGIHGLTELVRAVEATFGGEPREVFGLPTRTSDEICALIQCHRDIASRLGRDLADRFGFAYPAELEAMVRQQWDAFRRDPNGPTPATQ